MPGSDYTDEQNCQSIFMKELWCSLNLHTCYWQSKVLDSMAVGPGVIRLFVGRPECSGPVWWVCRLYYPDSRCQWYNNPLLKTASESQVTYRILSETMGVQSEAINALRRFASCDVRTAMRILMNTNHSTNYATLDRRCSGKARSA